VFDWILECDQLGFHRKISSSFPFHLLTKESKYFGIHSNAGLQHPEKYAEEYMDTDLIDPCEKQHLPGFTCINYLTNDLVGELNEEGERGVTVHCADFDYEGFIPPSSVTKKDKHVRSIFIALPIGMVGNFKYYTDSTTSIEDRKNKIANKLPEFMELVEVKVGE
jgi:hypothetical protein